MPRIKTFFIERFLDSVSIWKHRHFRTVSDFPELALCNRYGFRFFPNSRFAIDMITDSVLASCIESVMRHRFFFPYQDNWDILR